MIEELADKTRGMAVMLVNQLAVHPERVKEISIIFGFTVPYVLYILCSYVQLHDIPVYSLVFLLSEIVDEATKMLTYSKAIMSTKVNQLETSLLALQPLINGTEERLIVSTYETEHFQWNMVTSECFRSLGSSSHLLM